MNANIPSPTARRTASSTSSRGWPERGRLLGLTDHEAGVVREAAEGQCLGQDVADELARLE
jgi:hypothetical protein